MAANVTIYHNPRCSKSRQTLQLLEDRGLDATIVEYLKDPPDAKTLEQIATKLGIEPAELIRSREYKELDLPPTDEPAELFRRMAENPQIIQRPIVVKGNHARIGRPPEDVLEIL
ncbi:MAG: arsenate reductase [Pirellulaceae bacterium]|jgi:arsenate reductase